jgi:hypothetical protein
MSTSGSFKNDEPGMTRSEKEFLLELALQPGGPPRRFRYHRHMSFFNGRHELRDSIHEQERRLDARRSLPERTPARFRWS